MLSDMNWLLIASALCGFATAIGHSAIGERVILGPMFKLRDGNRILESASARRLLRWIWHAPSFAWAQIAAATAWLALYPADFNETARNLLLFLGIGIYATAALLNTYALRAPSPGNILLSIAIVTLWFGVA